MLAEPAPQGGPLLVGTPVAERAPSSDRGVPFDAHQAMIPVGPPEALAPLFAQLVHRRLHEVVGLPE